MTIAPTCARNWSTFKFIHSQKKKREFISEGATNLVFVVYD
jgi:hypothetical protein